MKSENKYVHTKMIKPAIYFVGHLLKTSSSETNNIYVIVIPKIKVKSTTNIVEYTHMYGLEFK